MSRAIPGIRHVAKSCVPIAVILMALPVAVSGIAIRQPVPPPIMTKGNLPPCDTPQYYPVVQQYDRRGGIHGQRFVSGPSLTTNESHDCQRLIHTADNGTMSYGPLVALLVAIDRVGSADFNEGRVVAEIVNHSDTTYAPLNIQPGISCLWLQGPGSDETTWSASIVRPSGRDCFAPVDPAAGHQLQVRRHAYDAPDYPRTGRWMWDHTNDQQFIGIACGLAWCELGNPGFVGTQYVSEAYAPGWSDEQYVAHEAQTGQLRVSGLFGTIKPTDELHKLENQDFDMRPAHVATIVLDGNDPPARRAYAAKFNAECACGNVIELYVRTGRDDPYEFSTTRLSTGNWNPMNQQFSRHAGKRAVRWAWSERDEGAWLSCKDGCCRTDS